REFCDLPPHVIKEVAADDVDGLHAILDHSSEGAGKLARLPDLDGLNRHASAPGTGLCTEPEVSGTRIVRIHEDGETREPRPALRQELNPLPHYLPKRLRGDGKAASGNVAAGSAKARDISLADRVVPIDHDNRN